MKKILSLLFACLSAINANSQTVVWQIKPSDYNSIEFIGNDLYKVSRGNKIGIINSTGNILAPIENDNISLYYEHKALLTLTDSHGERVTGVLTDEGKYNQFKNKYYTLNGQKFYSDGLLSVADENGKVGYIDDKGNQVLGFDGKFTRIKPFTEGYAAVYKNKKYHLIDKSGTPVNFFVNGIGTVDNGTNVFNGIVYLRDTYEEKFYTFDVNRGGACKKIKEPANFSTMDYLYCIKSITGREKDVPFYNLNIQRVKGIEPTYEGGLYSYKKGNETVVPKQFTNASTFENGLAIVTLNNKIGVIKYIDGSSFNTRINNNQYNFYAGRPVTCKFNISTPSIWENKEIKVELIDESGQNIPLSHHDDYSFNISPTSSGQRTFVLSVYGDNLKLYETNLKYSFIKKTVCSICGKDLDICKGKHTHSTDKVQTCPTCGKDINDCPVNGDHSKVIY